MVYLVSSGVDIRAEEAVRLVSQNGHLPVVQFVSSGVIRAWDDEAVCCASENGHLDVVRYLVSLGADARDGAAVSYASRNGHLDVVRYLVSLGANIRAWDDEVVCRASENAVTLTS